MEHQDVARTGPSVRERIVDRFRQWLDEALAHEAPPPGIAREILAEVEGESPAEDPSDLHALRSAMTALAQEVGLQGRAFHQLKEVLAPVEELGPKIEAAMAAHERGLAEMRRIGDQTRAERDEWQRRAVRDAAQAAWKKILDLLLDMRDRLGRGIASAREALDASRSRPLPGWWDRLRGRIERDGGKTEQALIEGATLALARLDDTLAELGVSEIDCARGPFDPQRMKAVELGAEEGVPEGQVLAVLRRGYEWRGEVYRPAEVKVARRGGV